MSDKEDLGLVEGWTYEVASDKDTVSKGVFIGYAMIGSESAVVLQTGERMRSIPVARILHIDLLGRGERKRTEERKPDAAYYG